MEPAEAAQDLHRVFCSSSNVFPELFATSQPWGTAIRSLNFPIGQINNNNKKTPTLSVAFFFVLQKQDVIFQNMPDD